MAYYIYNQHLIHPTLAPAGILAEQEYVGANANQIGISEEAYASCINCVNVRQDPSCLSVKGGTKFDQFEQFRVGLAELVGRTSTAAINTLGLSRSCG